MRYHSTEGIYEWSMLELTDDYFYGWQEEADLSPFKDIRTGLRGEYRLHSVKPPETYFSPIDNRLHLKWAEAGVWRLDEKQIIRIDNLDNDEYIDVWSREVSAATVRGDARAWMLMHTEPVVQRAEEEIVTADEGTAVIEALYALPGHLLHDGGTGLTLIATAYEPALFETLPPTDHETWKAHLAQLSPYEAQQRNPANLRSWLDAFPGTRSEIAGASVANVRRTGDGFRFELVLEPGYQASGPNLLELAGLVPGKYLVENHDGAFTVTLLRPPQLALEVRQAAGDEGMARAQVSVRNLGTADAPDLTLVAEAVNSSGAIVELAREPVDALAGETVQVLIDSPTTAATGSVLNARLEDATGLIVAISGPTPLVAADIANNETVFSIAQAPVLLPVIGLFSAFVALAAVLAASRLREQVR
jgi:hypothetical protein